MAILTSSVLGPISGKVGTLVGGTWKGIPYVRSVAATVSNPQSPAQQEQRLRFSLILDFLQVFIAILRLTFRNAAVKMTSFNAAMSANVKTAVKGIYPALELDYTKIILSKGILPGLMNPAQVSVQAGKIDITWEDNSADEGAASTDLFVYFVYLPTLKRGMADVTNKTRLIGTDSITLPDAFSGQEAHVWGAFQNPVTGDCSDSYYIGQIAIV